MNNTHLIAQCVSTILHDRPKTKRKYQSEANVVRVRRYLLSMHVFGG